MNAPGDGPTCAHGRDGLAVEVRALTLHALDRLDPVLARLRDLASAEHGTSAAPAVCPLCAAMATVRGERPDVAGRLADHATGLVAALRDALAEAGSATPEPPTAASPTRVVQHIPVERESRAEGAPC